MTRGRPAGDHRPPPRQRIRRGRVRPASVGLGLGGRRLRSPTADHILGELFSVAGQSSSQRHPNTSVSRSASRDRTLLAYFERVRRAPAAERAVASISRRRHSRLARPTAHPTSLASLSPRPRWFLYALFPPTSLLHAPVGVPPLPFCPLPSDLSAPSVLHVCSSPSRLNLIADLLMVPRHDPGGRL